MTKLVVWMAVGVGAACAAAFGIAWRVYVIPPTPPVRVAFPSDTIELGGELFLPDGVGPFPAAVILHGSGPLAGSPIAFRMHAVALAKRGIAALTYDKRGVGRSGGTYRSYDLRGFMADAEAALDFLAGRPEIDGTRLGIVANSESGLFTPEIVSSRRDLTWAYVRVGPATPYEDVVRYQVGSRLRASGYAADAVEEILALHSDLTRFLIRGATDSLAYIQGRPALQARLSALYEKYDPADLPFGGRSIRDVWDPETLAAIAYQRGYDPERFLDENSRVSMLWVFGGEDVHVDTKASVTILEEARKKTGQRIATFIYEGDDHTLNKWVRFPWGTYPRGYFRRMTDFALHALAEEAR